MKRFFDFEAKFGWSELIALIAVIVAFLPHFMRDPLKEMMARHPQLHVTQAELKDTKYFGGEKAFYVTVRNVGNYPVDGLQFAFDVFYLNKKSIKPEDIRLSMEPKYAYDLQIKQQQAYLRIKNALPPNQDFSVIIFGRPLTVSVMTDFGNSIYLSPSRRVMP